MPSAPPNSEPVSEIAAATPARSGGALPTMRSVASVNTGARPEEVHDEPGHEDRERGRAADLRQRAEANCRDRETADHHV